MAFPRRLFNPQELSFTPQQLFYLRKAILEKLFVQKELQEETPQQIARIAEVLSRSASNEATAYESVAIPSRATSSTNTLTRQVERAFAQVLGRSPGRGSEGFMKALDSAFPIGANGQVVFTPSRSVVSTYGSADGDNLAQAKGKDLKGQLSVEQATLYRQASIMVADALRVLEGIEPFDSSTDLDAVEALRALVASQLNSLIEEFGRLDEPRRDRVDIYFQTLQKNLVDMGRFARFSDNSQNLVNADDEAQVAAYGLVLNYVATLKIIWQSFTEKSPAERASNSYSERLSRVSVMLPVITDSTASLLSAMDSVGFTESERRSDSALFSSLNPNKFELKIPFKSITDNTIIQELKHLEEKGKKWIDFDQENFSIPDVNLPRITVNDFSEWVDRFASFESPEILATSGRFGLDFVTDQADTLFWVIGIVLDYLKYHPESRSQLLGKILTFDRVQQNLVELVSQLKTLADLGVVEPRFS